MPNAERTHDFIFLYDLASRSWPERRKTWRILLRLTEYVDVQVENFLPAGMPGVDLGLVTGSQSVLARQPGRHDQIASCFDHAVG